MIEIPSITPSDSLTHVQAEIVAMAEKLQTTPADVIISDLLSKAVRFGVMLLAAIAI